MATTTILELMDYGGSVTAFAGPRREYIASLDTQMADAIRWGINKGYTHIISLEKNTGFIPTGREWSAWVSGALSAGPFFGVTAGGARLQAEGAIRGRK